MARTDFNGITEQLIAAQKRLRDAQALLNATTSADRHKSKGRHARGAMYLAGYAVECKIKATAMKVFRCRTLAQLATRWKVDDREVYTHGLIALARRLPLYSALRHSTIWPDFVAVMLWRPSWRYDPNDWANKHAQEFLISVARVYDWIERNH